MNQMEVLEREEKGGVWLVLSSWNLLYRLSLGGSEAKGRSLDHPRGTESMSQH